MWVMKVGVGLRTPNNFKHGVNLRLMQVLHSLMGLTPNGSSSKLGGSHMPLCVSITLYKAILKT